MNLKYLRWLINIIDLMILCLLRARQIVVTRVAQLKKANGITTLDPDREKKHLLELEYMGGLIGLIPVVILEVFSAIMSSSRAQQSLNRGEWKPPAIDNNARCIPCGWRTAGIDGPPGSTKRICPGCRRPLSS